MQPVDYSENPIYIIPAIYPVLLVTFMVPDNDASYEGCWRQVELEQDLQLPVNLQLSFHVFLTEWGPLVLRLPKLVLHASRQYLLLSFPWSTIAFCALHESQISGFHKSATALAERSEKFGKG